jgi:hypothetical protein
MDAQALGDQLHRSVKLALDSGEATTLAEAEQLFQRYRLVIKVGPDIARSATLQAALLTAVNTGRRCFLGGVWVVGDLSGQLRVPWRRCATLAEAVSDLQGQMAPLCPPDLPRIVIGDAGTSESSPYAIRATFDGWSGGVIPLEEGRLAEQHEFIPSGVLAGALAVSEVFQGVRGSNAQAGHRPVGLSLWRPEASVSWLDTGDPGPALEFLPAKLWLIGLGHLGQAFLWMLGLLLYAQPDEVELVLQDTDVLVEANDSTSLLTSRGMLGQNKTRAIARWYEERGFRIQERRFAPNFRVAEDEPQVALCGVDNPQARSARRSRLSADHRSRAWAWNPGVSRVPTAYVSGEPSSTDSLGRYNTPS